MSKDQKQFLINYLFKTGKEKIKEASVRSVDLWAEYFVEELRQYDEQKAEELYKYYEKRWG